jgi:hypothetical protein
VWLGADWPVAGDYRLGFLAKAAFQLLVPRRLPVENEGTSSEATVSLGFGVVLTYY